MRILKLMTDYQCFPLWGVAPDDIGDIDPASLPLSDATQQRLLAWAHTYDCTLDHDDPSAAGFATIQEAAAFEKEGIALWLQLQQELGADFEIWFFNDSTGAVLKHPSELEDGIA